MALFIKEETKKLGEDIVNNYNSWGQSKYTFGNGSIEIWNSNGVRYIDFYPNIGAFGFFEKKYIYRCIKKSKINKALDKNES